MTVYSGIADPAALRANTVQYLIDLVRVLNEQGKVVRIKGHPAIDNSEFFQVLFSRMKLDATVIPRTDGLQAHALWADVANGPVSSGALIQTIALGCPYVGFVPEPSSIDCWLFSQMPVILSATDLQTLADENPLLNADDSIDQLCALSKNRSATECLFRVLDAG